ncbi:MAG: sle [Frankiales bacterium]|nr:sle [Frankiales bacterium]
MIVLSLQEVAELIQGRIVGADPRVLVGGPAGGHVEFDSRKVSDGDLFLAVEGENTDGHRFAEAAMAAGAVAVIATRPVPVPAIMVDDPVAAITALAAACASRLTATIIGVTGSSGKTSTKDLLAQVLAAHGRTVAPPGSFNNELGHPYTVLLADEQTEFLILETSARGIGHIAHLARIAPPRIGAVLNVGSAHVGEFGSIEAIAQAKGELVEALPAASAGGVAVLNADDAQVLRMSARTPARVLTFGERRGADVRAESVRLDDLARPGFELVIGPERALVALRVHGEHQVANALAAAAIASACGMPVNDIAAALSKATSRSRWRMEITETAQGVTVINDTYNANPESMRAALKSLVSIAHGRRTVALLGQMAELGETSIAAHDAIGRLAVRLDVSQLVAVGPAARPIANGAALEGSWNGESEWVADVPAAIARAAELVEAGDVVLVKGSRSVGMERVAQAIIDAGRAAPR